MTEETFSCLSVFAWLYPSVPPGSEPQCRLSDGRKRQSSALWDGAAAGWKDVHGNCLPPDHQAICMLDVAWHVLLEIIYF